MDGTSQHHQSPRQPPPKPGDALQRVSARSARAAIFADTAQYVAPRLTRTNVIWASCAGTCEHASRRVRVPAARPHSTATHLWRSEYACHCRSSKPRWTSSRKPSTSSLGSRSARGRCSSSCSSSGASLPRSWHPGSASAGPRGPFADPRGHRGSSIRSAGNRAAIRQLVQVLIVVPPARADRPH